MSTLPPELWTIVIDQVDVRTLVRCREVCKILRNLIDHSPSFQYKIELAVAGMDDGPPSDLGPIERLRILNAHQTAWNQLSWKDVHFPKRSGIWVCSGNVLAKGYRWDGDFLITLTQLPSVLRGIEEKTWSIAIKRGDHYFCSYQIDPSQDLIVLVEVTRHEPDLHVQYRHVYLHMLSTGEPHPLSSGVLIHRERPRSSFPGLYWIQIIDDMVGVQCVQTHHLTIWDWKTGELRMDMWEGPFSFLTKDLVMTSVTTSFALNIYDLRRSSGTPAKVSLLCTFEFPQRAPSTSFLVDIFTDISSGKTSRHTHSAPFHISQNDRLYAVRFGVTDRNPFSLMVFAPLSAFMARIDGLRAGETGRSFSWEEWGEKDARVLEFDHQFHARYVPVSCIHGMKFSIVNDNQIEVYDFNRLSFKRGLQSGTAHRLPLSTNGAFMRPVYSSLPYQVRSAPMPDGHLPRLIVSITEDCLIPIQDWDYTQVVSPIFGF